MSTTSWGPGGEGSLGCALLSPAQAPAVFRPSPPGSGCWQTRPTLRPPGFRAGLVQVDACPGCEQNCPLGPAPCFLFKHFTVAHALSVLAEHHECVTEAW